ncbi:hypothetical protein BUALT_Bualt14G0056400 [Buddleja alternifolia]|uniref:Uncharacterized protein n=1 Tax=Buddleja alternifolia TaxID=168488 RepID=A0AAV6WID5_9LAMI|nr:hypothetical protein BUALT_Bualt14G0056400 [Buddleja alternifolia]
MDEEGKYVEETGDVEDTMKHPKEEDSEGRHEQHTTEAFKHSQTKSIQDLSKQVYELSLKIDQLSSRSSPINTTTTSLLPPIELPKFSGEDVDGWIYKFNQMFLVYKDIPDETKVRLASIHMEGDALRWHKEFVSTSNSSLVVWDEYVNQLESKFRDPISDSIAKKGESTPLIEMKKPRRRICKLQCSDDGEIFVPKKLHVRFGPIYYRTDEDLKDKKKAWQHVLDNTPNCRAAVTTENYLSAVRLIENEARNCYPDGETDFLTGSEFRWMMIFDGCFFLQIALHLLGKSQQLGYPPDDTLFGKSTINARFRDAKDWVESMFLVGNQIPLVVLKELMKQSYFKKVIKEGKWEEPSELYRKALYELLFVSRLRWLHQQQPTDLIHGLHLLVLGPELNSTNNEEDEDEYEEEDVEAQHEADDSLVALDDKVSSSATDLKQKGIHFWVSREKGSRGICFTNTMWLLHGYPILHMPPILMNEDTELMLSCLRNYEISQKLSMSKREICSYLRFMSELIRTPGDAKIMSKKKIIQGEDKLRHKLPGILRRLASKDTYNQNLRVVKLKISDYSPPIWKKYWHIISLGLIITVLQTVYTILPYYKKGS